MDRQKKIVFTVTNDLSYDQRMDRICKCLTEAGYAVTLIGFTKKQSLALQAKKYRQVRLNLVFRKGKLFYLEYNFRLFWKLLSERPDIYGAIDLDTILPHYIVSRIRRKQLVHDAHEYFTELPEISDRPFIKKIWERLAKIILSRTVNNYTVCQSIATELEQKYGQPYAVIRNVPEYTPFSMSEFRSPQKIFIYQGALNKGRGIEQMIHAMEFVPAVLWLIGEGDLSEDLRELAEAKPWSTRIVFKGFLLPEDLQDLTKQAYAGMNLVSNDGMSYYYSLSNKFFDYIKAGIPQITMDYPEYKNLNDNYQIAVTIPELEIQQIANSMNLLMEDPVLYNNLKENTEKAYGELNWSKEKIKLIDFYAHIK